MVALQPPVGGLPTARRSFAEVLESRKSVAATDSTSATETTPEVKHGLHKGEPAVFLNDQLLKHLSKPYEWSLVGKFSQGFNKQNPKLGRPSLDDLHKYFLMLDMKKEFNLGLLDNRHVIIHFCCEEDYLRLYSRMVWYIGAVTMRIFKWSPYFRVDKESPIVPIWISFPRLPIMLFQQETLFDIARLIGTPLRCDAATAAMKRPSVARLQIEADVTKDLPSRIWIGIGENDGYWQKIDYEYIPDYCNHCWHVGHKRADCNLQNFKQKEEPQQGAIPLMEKAAPTQQWVPKLTKHSGENLQNPAGSSTNQDNSIEEQAVVSDIIPSAAKVTTAKIDITPLVASVDLVDSDEDSEPLLSQETGFTAQRIKVDGIPTQNGIDPVEPVIEEPVIVPVEAAAIPNLATTPHGPVVEVANDVLVTTPNQKQVNSCTMGDKVDLDHPSVVTTGDPLEMPTGIYFRQQIPLLRRSASSIGLTQSNKEDTPRHESALNLDNEPESEEDNDTEAYEDIIVMDQMGRLRLQLQPVTPIAINQGKALSPAVSSESKNVISPVPSAPSPTASPGEDGVLPLKSLSAPEIIDSVTDSSSTAMLQDEPSFQQPKNRRRKKKTQENSSQSRLTIASTASAFAILPDE